MMQFVGLVGTRLGQRQVNLGISSFLTTHNPGWCYFRPTSGGGLTCLLAVLKRISGWRILRPFHGWCWHILWCIFGSIPTGPRRTLSSGASTQVYARDSSTQFFNFSIFQFFNFSIFQFSNFSIFPFSHFPIFLFSYFQISERLLLYREIATSFGSAHQPPGFTMWFRLLTSQSDMTFRKQPESHCKALWLRGLCVAAGLRVKAAAH